MKCIVISELNKNTLWNYFMQVTNDAADDDLSRSMIFNTWLESPVASPHYVAEFENEVNCNFRIEQKY